MNVQTVTEILLKACRLSPDQLMRRLEPTNGLPPANDQEYTNLCTRLRRMGHIIEGHHGNIASLLQAGRPSSRLISIRSITG